MIFAAGDENVAVGQLPAYAGYVLQVEGGALEGVEPPEARDGAGYGVGSCGSGGWGRQLRRGWLSLGMYGVEHQAVEVCAREVWRGRGHHEMRRG